MFKQMINRADTTTVCALAGILLAVSVAFYAIYALYPPAALPADAPPEQFSAHRAIEHAFACSMEPHPAGSKNNDAVAQYFLNALKDMGVEAEFMAKPEVHGHSVIWQQAVIGRIPGTASSGAVAFSAHYDSVPYGPGATDDIAGCVAMLEAARAFMNQPRMRNDLLFIFADAEEIGGFGASGFCSHPLAADIGIINELDVRGVAGPALIYEMSPGNGALIRELRKARSEGVLPVSNSLMFAVYQAMPFGGDFTRFRNAGMKGYGLAYIDNFMWYHTANDTPGHMSPESIQHFGVHVMGISKHFGNADFDTINLQSKDEIYFNSLGSHMIQYPMSLAIPLAALAIVTLLAIIGLGFVKRRLTLGGYFKSLLLAPFALVISAAAALAIFAAAFGFKNVVYLYTVKLSYIPEPRALYDGNLYCCSLGLMAIALTGGLYFWASHRLRSEELHAAALTWLCLVLVVLAVYLPGGSYLFTWPILFGAIGLAVLYRGGREQGPEAPVLFLAGLFAIPALCLLPPGWQQAMWGINILGAPILAVLAVLILLNLMPVLVLVGRMRRGWLVWAMAGVAALVLLATGVAISGPSKDRPLMDSVAYAANLDTQTAFWLSEDPKVDEWTKQFFPDGTRAAIEDVVPDKSGDHYLRAPAPVAANLTGIRCDVTEDTVANGKRHVMIRLWSDDSPFGVRLRQMRGPKIDVVTVNSMAISADDSLAFRSLPRDGYVIRFETTPGEPLVFEAFSSIYGFPQIPGIKPRPDYIVPETNLIRNGISLRGEHMYIRNSFTIPAAGSQ
jgi:hypothetical protein